MAFDASSQMCRKAHAYTNLPIIKMSFQEMSWDNIFDGIWACASLLHVPRMELPGVLQRIARALRPGGVFYASFKHGDQDRIIDGRHFTDMTAFDLSQLLRSTELSLLEYWKTNDVRPGRANETWLNALSARKPHPFNVTHPS
jgi:SAM-dependent methyltransferase